MTGLLVSVRNSAEAEIALAGGTDLIDVKEPAHGPLGRAEAKIASEVVRCIAGEAPLSLALGELIDLPMDLTGSEAFVIPAGFQYAKVGLAGCENHRDWPPVWLRLAAALSPGTTLVPVIYADYGAAQAANPEDVLEIAIASRSRLVLIDTFKKHGGSLLDHLPMRALRRIDSRCERHDIGLVLAGSLTPSSVAKVLPLAPAFVAVRGAACTGGRNGTIDLARVKALRKILRGAAQKSRTKIA